MKKPTLILSTLAVALALTTGVAFADGENYGRIKCQPIYGGGESCIQLGQVIVNKFVQNPQTKGYVDNLGINDPKYVASQDINFKITVSNTSDAELSNLILKDVLPDFVDFVNAPGNYDKNSRTLTLNIDKLAANESRDFFITAKVSEKNVLPKDQNAICLINQASISMDGKTSQDNAQFCIEKEMQPKNPPTTKGGKPVFPPTTATTTPETGPEALALIGLIPSALGGAYLRKKTK